MRRPRQALNPAAAVSLVLLALGLSTGSVQAQEAEAARSGSGVTIRTGVSLSQTVTDNVSLTTQKDAALITVLTPNISVTSRGGRVTGTLDYALSGIAYLKTEQKNTYQQSLAARGTAELIEQHFFVDVNATISQQPISAFGTQSTDPTLANSNLSEVASIYIGPFLRGQVSDLLSYELRGNLTETNATESAVGDSRVTGGSLRVDSLRGRKFGWWAALSSQKSQYDLNRTTNETSLANLGLKYQPDPDLQLSINGGPERDDYLGFNQSGTNYGVNLTWLPSPRTNLLLDWQHHEYGDTHMFSFDHRLARSALRYIDTKSVMAGNQSRRVGNGTNYDLLFQQFSSLEPDPVKRDQLVRILLQSMGISSDALVSTGFLEAAPSMQRLQQLAFSLTGVRTTVTATLGATDTERLGTIVPTGGDLAHSNKVHQLAASLTLAHQLTPISSANLTLVHQRSEGDTSSLTTRLRSAILNWTSRFGARAYATAGARYSEFDGAIPYSESAVFANLVLQF
jgi:uncharacterized protein (PEP-CTERM system associated)